MLHLRAPVLISRVGIGSALCGVLCLTSSCSSTNDDDDSQEKSLDNIAASGSRLSAQWDTPTDGEARFLGFYDSVKKAHCRFMLAEDGEQRCLPTVNDAHVYYEDDDCEVPTLWWQSGTACQTSETPAPHYASTLSTQSCPAAYSVYQVGKYLDDGTGKEQRRLTASGLCQGGVSDASYVKRFALNQSDDIQSWVKGDVETVSIEGSRIQVQYLRGQDGSYVRLGQYDSQLATPCIPEPMGESGVRCVPETGSFLADTFSANETCDTQAAATETRCDTDSPFLFDSTEDKDACALRSYFKREQRLGELYSALDCEPVELELMSAVFHAVGKSIEASEFVEISPERPTSPRLVRERFKDKTGQTIEPQLQERWFDNELKLLCSKQRTSDGEDRCVPGNFNEVIYKDSSCKKPVTKLNPCDSSKHVIYLSEDQLDSCVPVHNVYEIGKVIDVPLELFVRIGPDCTAFNINGEDSEYHNVIEVAPEAFVAFED